MKPLLLVVLLPLIRVTAAAAQNPFDGTWKLDPTTAQIQSRPDTYRLTNGPYDCATCDPPLHIKADGREQPIPGDSCAETISVSPIDARTVLETRRKKGAVVETSRMTVSGDGNTATMEWNSRCNPNGDLMTVRYEMTRVAAAPKGAHIISGSWRTTARMGSSNVFTVTLRLEHDRFSFADPVGYRYIATLDGPAVAMEGGAAGELVSLKRVAENRIEETHTERGDVSEIVYYELSIDGKTLKITIRNPGTGTTRAYTAVSQ